MNSKVLPVKKQWWEDYLHFRLEAILALHREGKTPEEIKGILNLQDESHIARLIAYNARKV